MIAAVDVQGGAARHVEVQVTTAVEHRELVGAVGVGDHHLAVVRDGRGAVDDGQTGIRHTARHMPDRYILPDAEEA